MEASCKATLLVFYDSILCDDEDLKFWQRKEKEWKEKYPNAKVIALESKDPHFLDFFHLYRQSLEKSVILIILKMQLQATLINLVML